MKRDYTDYDPGPIDETEWPMWKFWLMVTAIDLYHRYIGPLYERYLYRRFKAWPW